jgi:hypothetical protein
MNKPFQGLDLAWTNVQLLHHTSKLWSIPIFPPKTNHKCEPRQNNPKLHSARHQKIEKPRGVCQSGFTTLPPVPLLEQHRCGSFVRGAQIARRVGYPGIRRTRRFTWFGPPERNTLRPRVKGVVLLCLSARLRSSLFSPSVRVCEVRPFVRVEFVRSCVWSSSVPCDCRLPGPFIAQGRAVTEWPHGLTGGPGAGRPLRS